MPRRDPWPYIGLAAFFVVLFVAVFGERIAPHEPIYFVVEHGRDPRPYDPGLVFPFGSDILGRDLFSLVLAGARTTIVVVVLGGLARVLAGAVLGLLASLSSKVRVATDALSEIVAAVPATLVVLLVVLVFVRGDTTFLVFVGALLITGWAGPYRVFRAELDRLGHMGFTESAAALGLSRVAIALRHHVPHLVPMLALNLSQQSVASLVALAELGVLGVFVGTTRLIGIEESMSFVTVGQINRASIADPPEWGGLLANARSTENLWTTRWVFLVPGIAFAVLAIALAAVGIGLARRYARRDLVADVRGRGAGLLAAATLAVILLGAVVPPRYAAAVDWADRARASVTTVDDAAAAFEEAGLEKVGDTWTIERDVEHLVRTGAASAAVADATVGENSDGELDVLPLVFAESGGGRVEAPLVFASWGLSPADHHPAPILSSPDLGTIIADWPDDYATVDVRGKVAVVLRALTVASGSREVSGPDPETAIRDVLKRGPAGVIYVDPDLPKLPRVSTPSRTNGYIRLANLYPVRDRSKPPVLVLSPQAADTLLAPAGIRPTQIYADLPRGYLGGVVSTDTAYAHRSAARGLGIGATVDVPLTLEQARSTSVVGATPSAGDGRGDVLIWAVTPPGGSHAALDAAVAVARSLKDRDVRLVFVAFDPTIDPDGNAAAVAERLGERKISFVVVLDALEGAALRTRSVNGDLIAGFDLYADRAGARHIPTRTTIDPNNTGYEWPGIRPFVDLRSIVVSGDGTAGDLRIDAAATIGYLAGRLALDAEELR